MNRTISTPWSFVGILILTLFACGPSAPRLPPPDAGLSSAGDGSGGLEVNPGPSKPSDAGRTIPGSMGCTIAGRRMAASTLDPSDRCGICDPARDPTGWSALPDGEPCGSGSVCNAGSCIPGCFIQGTVYNATQSDPTDLCQTCQPAVSPSAWSPLDDGTPCGGGNFCLAGRCLSACVIPDGGVVPNGRSEPGVDCRSCDPQQSAVGYAALPDGTPCSHGGTFCQGGACAPACLVGGAVFSDHSVNPMDRSACCNPDLDPTHWSRGFRPGPSSIVPGGAGMVILDVNGDGIPDMVAPYEDQASVYLGNGDGTFTADLSRNFPTGVEATGFGVVCIEPTLIAADLDGDGKPDLVAYCTDQGTTATVSVLLYAHGTFMLNQSLPAVLDGLVAVGDFQRAGSADLAIVDRANGPSELTYYLNDGSGSYTPGGSVWVSNPWAGSNVTAIVAAPFLDSSGRSPQDDVFAALNDETGTLVPFAATGTVSPGLNYELFGPALARSAITTLVVADMSATGDSDVVALDAQGNVFLLTEIGQPSGFASQLLVNVGFGAIAVADVDGDGLPDILGVSPNSCGNITGELTVLHNNLPKSAYGQPAFTPTAYPVGVTCPGGLAVADFNRDGRMDILAGGGGGELMLGNCP